MEKFIIENWATVLSFVTCLGYIQFQAKQNKNDIEKLELKVSKLEEDTNRAVIRIFDKIDSSNKEVIDKIDSVKTDFVSVRSCDSLRAECHRG